MSKFTVITDLSLIYATLLGRLANPYSRIISSPPFKFLIGPEKNVFYSMGP